MVRKVKKPEYALSDEIIEAIINDKAVIFIGAGVSKQYGMPLWDELGNKMLLDCLEKKIINDKDYDNMLKRNYSPLQKVTIASQILDCSKKSICSYLDNKIEGKDEEKLETIDDCFWTFKCKIYTTNADMILETDAKELAAHYKTYSEIKKEYIDKEELSIIHVHGATSDPDSIVFTIRDYLKMYKKNSNLDKAINYLFSGNKYIIFAGYGINDFELLRQILDTKENHINKLFMLNEYYEFEKARLDAESKYYGDFGIKIIPYYLDNKGYDAFIDVLKYWKQQVIEKRLEIPKREKEFRELIEQLPNEENASNFNKFKRNINKKIFYEILEKSDYAYRWFEYVDQTDKEVKFNFKPATNQDGFIKCSPWYWLNCFYYVSKKGQENDNKLAINILNEALKYLKEDISYIKNYEVFNTLYKLLFSKRQYLEEVDYIAYTEFAFNRENVDKYSSAMTFKEGFNNLESIEIYKILNLFNLVIGTFEEMYMLDFFYSKDVLEYVYRKPEEFLDYCIYYLEKMDSYEISSLGSLIDIEKTDNLDNKKKLIIIWLKEAALKEDRSTIIKKVHLLLESDNKIYNKIAVYISTVIKYDKLFKYMPNIILKDHIYLDLADYISTISFSPQSREDLAKMIRNTNFNADLKKDAMLKNNLLKRIPYTTIDISLDELDEEKQRILVNNYGKAMYSYSDNIDYADFIYQRIKNQNYNELLNIKEELRNRITFFDSYWNVALSKYFACGNLDEFIKNIDDYLNEEFIICMNESVGKFSYTLDGSKKYINTIAYNDSILKSSNSIKSFVYLCKNIHRDHPESKQYFASIINKINLKYITVNENYKKWSFDKLINSTLFLLYGFLIDLESDSILEKMNKYPSSANDYIIAYYFKTLAKKYEKNKISDSLGGYNTSLFYTAFAYGNPDEDSFFFITSKDSYIDYLKKAKQEDSDLQYYYRKYLIYAIDENVNQRIFEKMIELNPFYAFKQLINILNSGYKVFNIDKKIHIINNILNSIHKNMYRKQMKDKYILNDILKCINLYDNKLSILWDFAKKSAPYFSGYDLKELLEINKRYHDINNRDVFEILKDMLESSKSLVYEDDLNIILNENFYPYFDEIKEKEIESIIAKNRKV